MNDKEIKKIVEDIFNTSIYTTEYLAHENFTDLFKRKVVNCVKEAYQRGFKEGSKATESVVRKMIDLDKEIKKTNYERKS